MASTAASRSMRPHPPLVCHMPLSTRHIARESPRLLTVQTFAPDAAVSTAAAPPPPEHLAGRTTPRRGTGGAAGERRVRAADDDDDMTQREREREREVEVEVDRWEEDGARDTKEEKTGKNGW